LDREVRAWDVEGSPGKLPGDGDRPPVIVKATASTRADGPVTAVAYSRDGKSVFTASPDGAVQGRAADSLVASASRPGKGPSAPRSLSAAPAGRPRVRAGAAAPAPSSRTAGLPPAAPIRGEADWRFLAAGPAPRVDCIDNRHAVLLQADNLARVFDF